MFIVRDVLLVGTLESGYEFIAETKKRGESDVSAHDAEEKYVSSETHY